MCHSRVKFNASLKNLIFVTQYYFSKSPSNDKVTTIMGMMGDNYTDALFGEASLEYLLVYMATSAWRVGAAWPVAM